MQLQLLLEDTRKYSLRNIQPKGRTKKDTEQDKRIPCRDIEWGEARLDSHHSDLTGGAKPHAAEDLIPCSCCPGARSFEGREEACCNAEEGGAAEHEWKADIGRHKQHADCKRGEDYGYEVRHH